ncbi:MAG: YceD family protein [Pseudomonadota bacterium]
MDVEYRRLARDGEAMSGTIPVARLGRLADQLLSADQQVEVELGFYLRRQRPSVRGRASVTVELTCQRCLEPMALTLDVRIDAMIVGTEDALASLEAHEDGIVCEDKRISIADLIEDDLLIDLPMSPRHEQCAEVDVANFRSPDEDEPLDRPEVNRPFAALAGMAADMKTKKKDV